MYRYVEFTQTQHKFYDQCVGITFFLLSVCALQAVKLYYIFYTYAGTTWLEFFSALVKTAHWQCVILAHVTVYIPLGVALKPNIYTD